MKNILAAPQQALIQEVARSQVLLAFDFDGTLAPLTTSAQQSRLRPATFQILRLIADLYPCAVISGRTYHSVASLLAGIPLRSIVGNFGAEESHRSTPSRGIARQISSWYKVLQPLSEIPGISLENKKFSISIHYRNAQEKKKVLLEIIRATKSLTYCRTVLGVFAVNLLPLFAPNKGDALKKIAVRQRCKNTVFLGDDFTDEDVFVLGDHSHPLAHIGIRVGRSAKSRAQYYLPKQESIDEFLQRLYQMRFSSSKIIFPTL